MKFFVFALAVVFALPSQSLICTPRFFECDFYDFKTTASGRHAVDWSRNISVVRFNDTGVRIKYLMTPMAGYRIFPDGVCEIFRLSIDQIPIRCIPENAEDAYEGSPATIGLADHSPASILSYDININTTAKVRVYFTNTTPAYPIFREFIGASSQFSGKLVFFTNPIRTTQPSPLLEHPVDCPTVLF